MSMSRQRVGVAISTTGDEHRMHLLRQSVDHWLFALPEGGRIFVTVDGSAEDVARVHSAVGHWVDVYQVGQPNHRGGRAPLIDGRQGVAVNKNTGLELLMDRASATHLFLSDDDTWPLYQQAIHEHADFEYPHSMVCWGGHRLEGQPEKVGSDYATWTWPRGVMLYVHRDVVYEVGGMDEAFGKGGHEHVEWSARIHNAGFTPAPYISPASYATRNAQGARAIWHCEDMPRVGEPAGNFRSRRRALTTIRRTDADREQMASVLASHEGDSGYVGFRAHENGRASATLSSNLTSQGADK